MLVCVCDQFDCICLDRCAIESYPDCVNLFWLLTTSATITAKTITTTATTIRDPR